MLSKTFKAVVMAVTLATSVFAYAAKTEVAEHPSKAPEVTEKPYQNTQIYTLKELGAKFPFNVIGVDGRNSVGFSMREDQMVTNASLNIHYSYSPSLIPELSSLNILMNDELVGTIGITKENAGQIVDKTFDIPAWMFVNYNQLGVQLIGHYTRECEDPLHSSLWARVSNKSTMSITTQPLKIPSDLALLPLPFFSRHDNHKLNLPIIFADMPENGEIEAAGYVASWLGQLSGYRGAAFSVKINQIPERGHAIVFMTSRHPLPLSELPEVRGAGLAIVSNPNDSYGKLLVIYGRTNDELKQAARALLLGRKAFSGPYVDINSVELPAPRMPYDAPFWIQQDRPVRFGEIVSQNLLSSNSGSQNVIRVPLRLPPDLFLRNTKGVPVYLKYRYTPRTHDDKSALNISVNDHFLASEPLLSQSRLSSRQEKLMDFVLGDKQAYTEKKIYLPDNLLSPYSELTLHFLFDKPKQGNCKDTLLDYLKDRGMVDADSSIDITNMKHFIHMPNLAAFANSGYPFTRLADLAETAIVLPEVPDTDTLEAYLQLMARMGESTGFPAIRLKVIKKSEMVKGLDKDLLVLEKEPGTVIWDKWRNALPVKFQDGQEEVTITKPFLRAWYWLFPDDNYTPEATINFSQYSKNGFMAGFESPFKSGRSVVLVAANDSVSFGHILDVMLNSEKGLADVQGSLVTVHEDKVRTLSAKTTYTLGSLGLWGGWLWYLSKHPFMSDLVIVIAALLVSLILTVILNAKAKRRLQGQAK